MSELDPSQYDDEFFEWEDRNDSVPYLNHCIAGSIAGISEHVAMLPFDNIKTHIQVEEGRGNALNAARTIYNEGKFRGFWKGASIMASGCVPAHAAYFSIYEMSKKTFLPRFHDEKDEIYPYVYAMTGALGTIIHDLIITPFDVLKQRKQIAPPPLDKTSELVRYMMRTEGMGSFYRSFPINMMMNIPQAAVIVSMNETLKIFYRPKEGHNIFSYFFCALTAGATAAGVTIPLDNIKTRLQTQNFYVDSRKEVEKSIKVDDKKQVFKATLHKVTARSYITKQTEPVENLNTQVRYKDILSTCKIIFKEQGVRGFFKGVCPRMIAQAPSSAISWSVYEMIKKFLAKSSSQVW